jgi:hypothetical protein
VEVWKAVGLVRYHVFFVIRLATRDVHIAGIVPEPHGRWMQQIARNMTDGFDGVLNSCKYLIHDRSTLYTEQFRVLLQSAGVQCFRLPPRSPNLNAFAERFVRSIKEECLDRLILLGESSLLRVSVNTCFIIALKGTIRDSTTRSLNPTFRPVPPTEKFCAVSASAVCSITTIAGRLDNHPLPCSACG